MLLGYGCTVGMVGCGGVTTITSQVVPTVQEEVVYLEGKVNTASDELTEAEKKLATLKASDQSAIDAIEDKNAALRRKYERLERTYM